MPARRIAAIAAKEFRGLMRDRLPYCIGLFALLWGLALRIVPPVAVGAGDKILIDVGVGAIGLLSALVVAFTGAEVMARDIERRTVLLVLSQPISRAALVLGKHGGLVSVAIALVAAMALLYFGGLSLAGVAYPLGSLSVALAFLVLELALLAAVALALDAFAGSLLAALLTLGAYVMGHASRNLLELGELSDSAGARALSQALYLLLAGSIAVELAQRSRLRAAAAAARAGRARPLRGCLYGSSAGDRDFGAARVLSQQSAPR